MSKIMHLVYDDYNGNLYGHIDYIGTITAHGCGCKALRMSSLIKQRMQDCLIRSLQTGR